MKRRAIPSLFLLPILFLAACNTTSGIGQDLQSAGSEIEKAAEGAK